MHRILSVYKSSKNAKGRKGTLMRIGFAALVGIGVMALFVGFMFGFVGVMTWLAALPQDHVVLRTLRVVIPSIGVLTLVGAAVFLAHIALYGGAASKKGN